MPSSVPAIASVLLVSAIPIAEGSLLPKDEATLRRVVRWLVCFAIGALLGAAFLHLIPEALANPDASARAASATALGGFLMFFMLERYLWRHRHDAAMTNRVRPTAALNLARRRRVRLHRRGGSHPAAPRRDRRRAGRRSTPRDPLRPGAGVAATAARRGLTPGTVRLALVSVPGLGSWSQSLPLDHADWR